MPTYDLTAHPMLSDTAAVMLAELPDKFDAHVGLAESMLELTDTSYTGSELDLVLTYLALQLNFQLEVFEKYGYDPFIVKSSTSSHTDQVLVFRGNPAFSFLLPLAVTGVKKLKGAYPGVVRSLRG